MKLNIYFLLMLLCPFYATGQNIVLLNEKVIGGPGGDEHCYIRQLSENRFVIGGGSYTDTGGYKTEPLCSTGTQDAWILIIDSLFQPVWDRSIGGAHNELQPKLSLMNEADHFLVSSYSVSDSSCEKSEDNRANGPTLNGDYWVVLMDSTGSIVWEKTWGGEGRDNYPQGLQLSDSSYIVAGLSEGGISGDKTVNEFGNWDYWLVRFDSSGNKLWDRVYGGNGFEQAADIYPRFTIIESNPGEVYLFGSTTSGISGNITTDNVGGFTNIDVIVWKLDLLGNILWQNRYGGTSGDFVNHVLQTDDGGLLVSGATTSPAGFDISQPPLGMNDCWVFKLDANGNLQWDARFGGSGIDVCTCSQPVPGGGYYLGGYTGSPAGFDVTEPSYGNNDYWIIRIDSIGNKIWDKRYGGPDIDYLMNLIVLPDSSIVLSGSASFGSSPVKSFAGFGSGDYWLVRIKEQDSASAVTELAPSIQVNLFPNPSTGEVQMPSFLNGASLSISDVAGRLVSTLEVPPILSVNLNYLPGGSYLFRFQSKMGNYYAKWVKM